MFAVLFGYFAFAVLFSVFIVTPEQEDIGEELGIGDENLAVAVIAVLLIVALAPVSEELFFRGFVYGGLRSKLSFWPALVIAGLIFGSIHAPTANHHGDPARGAGRRVLFALREDRLDLAVHDRPHDQQRDRGRRRWRRARRA